MKRLTVNGGWRDYVSVLRNREPFRTYGALYGYKGNAGTLGYLPDPWREQYYADANDIDYVVLSYATPIAWHTPTGWTVPDVRYSVTTSKHQGRIRTAVSQLERESAA